MRLGTRPPGTPSTANPPWGLQVATGASDTAYGTVTGCGVPVRVKVPVKVRVTVVVACQHEAGRPHGGALAAGGTPEACPGATNCVTAYARASAPTRRRLNQTVFTRIDARYGKIADVGYQVTAVLASRAIGVATKAVLRTGSGDR